MALDQNVGGADVGERIAQGFSKLEDLAQAQIDILTRIHQTNLGNAERQKQQDQQANLGFIRGAISSDPRAWQQAANVTQRVAQHFGVPLGQTTLQTLFGTQPTNRQGTPAGPPPGTPSTGPTGGGAGTPPPPPPPPPGGGGGGTGGSAGGTGGGGSGTGGPSGGAGGAAGGAPMPSGSPTPSGAPPVPSGAPAGPGLVNKIWGHLKGNLPVLGIGEGLLHEFRSQVNKDNYYIGVGGDASHGQAINDRMNEELARARYGLFFNEQEARQAFKGVTALGYTSRYDANNQAQGVQDRNAAMDYLYNGKKKYGATVDEGLGTLSVASKNALVDLQGLSDALDGLSESAGRAGVNAQQARSNMTHLLDVANQSGYGAGAVSQASAMASTVTMYGKGYQNLDPSEQMTSQGYRYMLAGRMGISITQLNARERHGDVGVSNAKTNMGVQSLQSYIQGASPQLWQWLTQRVQQDRDALTQNPTPVSQQIASDFWDQAAKMAPTLDPNAFLGLAQSFFGQHHFNGYMEATGYMVLQIAGLTEGAVRNKQQGKVGVTGANSKTVKGLSGANRTGLDSGGLNDLIAHGNGSWGFGLGDAAKPTQDYVNWSRKSGKRSGALEAILQGLDEDSQNKQMVQVRTKDGLRVVTLDEAYKHYSAQLESGQAQFVGGKYAGRNVTAFTGGQVDSSKATQSEAAKEGRQSGKGGQTLSDYYKAHPEDKPAGGGWGAGRVQIDLSPDAKKLIHVSGYKEDASGRPRRNDNGQIGSPSGIKANPASAHL